MTRTLPMEAIGDAREGFSPIPIEFPGGGDVQATDFAYGPTGTKFLSDVDSRHKLAWLWSVVWEAICHPDTMFDLDYHRALVMIDEHGRRLDERKGEREWEAILRGYRWSRGIYLPGELREDGIEVVYWENPPEEDEPILDSSLDYELTGHDCLVSNVGQKPTRVDLRVVAWEWDRLKAGEFEADCEALGFRPVR